MKTATKARSGKTASGLWVAVFAVATFVAGWLMVIPEAEACGGMFCNNQQPVRQAAERIIFSDNGDGTVTGIIQIRYQGPSEKFAWILPVPGKPEVGVGSNTALQRIKDATEPSFNLETTVDGKCKEPSSGGLFGGAAESAPSVGSADKRNDGGVEEIDSGAVGPYNYTTIGVSGMSDEPAKAALNWLRDNGYDVPDIGPDLIKEYLNDGMNLVAIKLQKDSNTGDIRPLKVTYEHPLPMIPIKLTAVAANQDMGVLVWLLGRERGIPTRYKHLKLNMAAVNWFQWRANYDDVVTQAASEAGGQGFVTEYADETSELKGTIFSKEERDQWESLNNADKWKGKEGELLLTAVQRYSGWDGLRQALVASLPSEMNPQQVINNPQGQIRQNQGDIEDFEVQAFLDVLGKEVVKPMRETEKLLGEREYVTRLYTTMSPEEMTVDPTFDFNADMGDVSNVHTAERTVYCSRRVTRANAPWKAVLPDGTVVHGEGNQWPLGPNANDAPPMPATRTIETTGTSGKGKVVEDNTESISQAVSKHNASVPLDPGGCGGCSTNGDSVPVGGLLVVLVSGGALLRRRRG